MAKARKCSSHTDFQAFYTDNNSKQKLMSSLLRMERKKMKFFGRIDNPFGDNDIEDCLLCPNCKGVLVEPYTLTCGHTICRFCLSDDQFGGGCCFCEGIGIGEVTAPTFLLCNVTKRLFPQHVELVKIKNAAQKLLQQKHFQGALKYLISNEVLDGRLPLDCNYYCLRSDCNALLGNLNLALDDIENALRFSAHGIHILKRKANILLKMGSYEKAMIVYARVAALQPKDGTLKKEINSSLNGLLFDFTDMKEAVSQRRTNNEKNVEVDRDDVMNETVNSSIVQDTSSMLLGESFGSQSTLKTHCSINMRESSGSERKSGHFTSDDSSCNLEQFLTDELDCKLCCSLLLKPVTTPCGHTFCDECLRRSLDFRVDCPCCRTPLTKYLSERRTNITLAIDNIIKILFPREYHARKKAFDCEMESLKSASQCSEFETPIFVCTLGFPSVPCPLHIFEPRYKLMIRRCIESGSRQFGICTQSPDENHPFAMTGTMLKINDIAYLPDGRSLINTVGGQRFEVLSNSVKDGYNIAKVRYLVDENVCEQENSEILKLNVKGYKLLKFWYDKLPTDQKDCIVNAIGNLPNQEELDCLSNDEPKWLWWALAALPLMDKPKLIILSMTSILERLRSIWRFLMMMITMQTRNSTIRNESL